MKEKINFKNIAIVSVILIVVGLMLYGAAFFTSGGKVGARLTNDGWEYNYSSKMTVSKETVPSFKNLDMQVKYRKIKLVESNEFAVEVRSSEKLEYEVVNNTLKIVDTTDRRSSVKGFNMSIMNFNIGIPYEDESEVTIYFPANTEFDKVTFNGNSSSLGLVGVNAKELVSNSKYSAMNLENCEFGSVFVSDESSAVNIENLQAERVELSLKYGAFDVENLKVKEAIKINGNSVSLNFNGIVSEKLDITSKYDTIDITNANVKGFDLINNSGMVSVSGIIAGNANISTKNGSIDLNLKENKDNYKIITSERLGSVSISGKNNPDGKYTINVEADSANVEIDLY